LENGRNEGIKNREFRIVNSFILKEIVAKKKMGFTKINLPKLLIFWSKKQLKMAYFWQIVLSILLIINKLEWFRKSLN